MEAAYGPDHLYLVHPLTGLGKVAAAERRQRRGAAATSSAPSRLRIATASSMSCWHESLAGLAELAAQARDPSRMQALFERAIAVYAASVDPESPKQAETALRAGELPAQLGERASAIAWFEQVLASPPEINERARLAALATMRLATTLATRKPDVPRACALVADDPPGPAPEDHDHAELRALQVALCPRSWPGWRSRDGRRVREEVPRRGGDEVGVGEGEGGGGERWGGGGWGGGGGGSTWSRRRGRRRGCRRAGLARCP